MYRRKILLVQYAGRGLIRIQSLPYRALSLQAILLTPALWTTVCRGHSLSSGDKLLTNCEIRAGCADCQAYADSRIPKLQDGLADQEENPTVRIAVLVEVDVMCLIAAAAQALVTPAEETVEMRKWVAAKFENAVPPDVLEKPPSVNPICLAGSDIGSILREPSGLFCVLCRPLNDALDG